MDTENSPRLLIISTSLDPKSRSHTLATLCQKALADKGTETEIIDLRQFELPNFDNDTIYQSAAYIQLHEKIALADGLILASPVYNWSCCAELKKLIEYVGSTPPEGPIHGALFDKVVTFVNSAGLPHSYTAFTGLANSLMLDFKCVINPYNLYVHSKQWIGDAKLDESAEARLKKCMKVAVELSTLLQHRSYQSKWEI